MKKTGFLLMTFLFFSQSLFSYEIQVGEKLKYEVKVNGLRLGTLTLEVEEMDKDFFEIVGKTDFLKIPLLPDMNFDFGCLIAKEGGLPKQYYTQRKGEPKKTYYFDQDKGKVIYPDHKVFAIPLETHNLISGFYCIRGVKTKKTEVIKVHHKEKNILVRPEVEEKEKTETVFGEVLAILVRSGKVSAFNSRFEVWLSPNEERIPLRVKGIVANVFEFGAVLIGYEKP